MSDEAAFLKAIQDYPDDDGPRLVYADWLEERGGPANAARALFIRLQCERARLPTDDPRRLDLLLREEQLLLAHCHEWPFASGRIETYRRGFCTGGLAFLGDYLVAGDGAAELAFASRVLWQAWKGDDPQAFERLAADVRLGFWENLTVNDWAGPTAACLRALVASPHLTALDSLRLTGCLDAAAVLRALAGAPALGRLTALELVGAVEGPQPRRRGYRPLAGAPGLREFVHSDVAARLARLDLEWVGLTDAGARLLAGAPGLAGLRWLALAGNTDLTPAGLAALANSPHLAGLETLDLANVPLDAAGVAALCRAPHWPRSLFLTVTLPDPSPDLAARLRDRYANGVNVLGAAGRPAQMPADHPRY
jgi:uncharacterized protein (TIGR02996 family)